MLVLATAVAVALAAAPGSAWSNGGYSADLNDPDYGTHDWIADRALDLQTMDVSYLQTTYHTQYLLGTEAPDNPEFIGDSTNHHVYYYSSGALQDNASAARASQMYDLALARLVAGDFSVAAYYTGAMTHYIADVGVFGHTMGAYTDWGAEVHHSDYESYFESVLDLLNLPSSTPLGYLGAYDATLGLARNITFGSGGIKPNTWMDENYDWSDGVFAASAMASLHASVAAVAAAINHLMTEAWHEPPEEGEEPVEEQTVPGAPASLEAYVGQGCVTLVWAPPTSDGGKPIIEYWVFRAVGTGNSDVLAKVSSLSVSWVDGDVEGGCAYTYRVAARNSVGLGELSDPATVTTPDESEEDEGLAGILLIAVASGVMAAASGGAIAWRRSRKGGSG